MINDWNIGKLINKRTLVSAEETAMIFEGRYVTYKELNDAVNRTVHFLQSLGVKKGDRLAVGLLNCVEFLWVYFATAKLGIILVPLDYHLVENELTHQLRDSGSCKLIFSQELIDRIEPIRADVPVEKDRYFCLNEEPDGNSDLPDWTGDFRSEVDKFDASEPVIEETIQLEDPVTIIYCPSDTGLRKGAVLSDGQTYFKNFQIRLNLELRKEDVILSQLPMFHAGGLFSTVTPAIFSGVPFVMKRRFNSIQYALDIERYGIR